MANSVETSDFTSIQQRLGIAPESLDSCCNRHRNNEHKDNVKTIKNDNLVNVSPASLLSFVKTNQECFPNMKRHSSHIPFALMDYLELVDWTGRQIRAGKRGYIPEKRLPIITTLGLSDDN